MNMSKQKCWGPWCPVVSNLRRPSDECVGKFKPIMFGTPLGPESFPYFVKIGEVAEMSAVRLRGLLLS